ncbi:MAG TPA: S8 family serine peptidase, partial [Bacteroidales bacterium]|nr:S8 family serine peptidase [Bacteroidales bacterium]
NGVVTSFSSSGPCDDGRIKPDVVANGSDVYSTLGDSDNSYGNYNGTSMATASVSGSIALLYELQENLQSGVTLMSSTTRGLIIHTAGAADDDPRPDYRTGWGIVNIKEAADLLIQNMKSGGQRIHEGVISHDEVIRIPVEANGDAPFLKVTVCWTDPPGQPSIPSLDPSEPKLVNDLDIKVIHSLTGQVSYPWILDHENPGLPAARGMNHTDNVEQVYLESPGENQYIIELSYSGTLNGGSQAFSLLVSGISTPDNILPPDNLTYIVSESSVTLNWSSPAGTTPKNYKVFRNGSFFSSSTGTTFTDQAVTVNETYTYRVTAVYDSEGLEIQSIPTNTVTACPRRLRALPFVVDFEQLTDDVSIENGEDGWRWGNSGGLSSYYLHFDSNTSSFIATDSYSAGELAHVSDVASTVPLILGNYTDIRLSFDYMLVSGIYGAVDELNIVYKLQEENGWHLLTKLPVALNWTHHSTTLPAEICLDGTQIGFYYDDLYQWGMGSALDNIRIEGNQTLSGDLAAVGILSPVSGCSLTENEHVIIHIKNTGEQNILSGKHITVELTVTPDIEIMEEIVLTDDLAVGEILSYQMITPLDLSVAGYYELELKISAEIDQNTSNNTITTSVEVYGFPDARILNVDSFFCVDEQAVFVNVSVQDGILEGTGVNGMTFDPALAGAGVHTII